MHLRFLGLALAFVVGCSSTTASKPTDYPLAATTTPPAAPRVPEDPMVLVPLEAELVASLNTDAIEGAPSFPKWRAWLLQGTCVGDAELTWLAANTRRAVFAGVSDKGVTELLLILDGRFVPEDRARALSLLDALLGEAAAARTERAQESFSVLTSERASAVVLDGRLMLVGTHAFVAKALARTGATPAELYATNEPFRRVAERLGCATQTACAVALADSRATRLLGKQLGSLGLGATGRDVTRAPAGLALDVSSGLRVQVVSEMASEADAKSAVKALNDFVWSMDVLARLAGLSGLLDEVKVSGSAAYVDVKASLTPSMLAELEGRIADMLGNDTFCTAQAVAEPPQ